MTHLHIAFATDDNYCQHAGCAIASILANSLPVEEFTFYILDGGITQENKDRLELLKDIKNFELIFLHPELTKLAGCPSLSYFTLNTYLRLLLPELLPKLEKILYLDCDMIVTAPLSELWNTDLENVSLGWVVNRGLTAWMQEKAGKWLSSDCIRLGLNEPYCNAGMLLMNLNKIRQQHLFQKVLEWITVHAEQVLFPDQDGLNVVFESDSLILPFKWNIQIVPSYKNGLFVASEYRQIANHPVGIIHYFSSEKPWQYEYDSPEKKYYWKYLKLTPWKNFKPQITFKKRVDRFKRSKFYRKYRQLRLWVKSFFKN